ncbi:30S ribosomal protein S7 [Candidatus Dojkabacteria bacterium]|nr:30S ribosomal protein S7 [Candidatus Dojkabacteria bacterium]
MRGKQAKERKAQADAVYNSAIASKLINHVMVGGKKNLAEKIVYSTMDLLKKDLKKEPLEILDVAIENVKPKLEVRPRRVGGVNYQVPVPVSDTRQLSLAIKWIVSGAKARRKKEKFYIALADELKDAYKNSGFAAKKKEDTHKMAEANKAFAHFQW